MSLLRIRCSDGFVDRSIDVLEVASLITALLVRSGCCGCGWRVNHVSYLKPSSQEIACGAEGIQLGPPLSQGTSCGTLALMLGQLGAVVGGGRV